MISVLTFGNEGDAPLCFTDNSAIHAWLTEGDEVAASWLYEKYLPLVRHICSRRLPRSWMANDATQETMVRGFHSLHNFDTVRRFSSWIGTIATRVCVDALRTFSRRLEIPVVDLDESAVFRFEAAPLELPNADRAEATRNLLGSLDPEVRVVVELYYLEGLTAREVANREGLSQGNVAIRLMRARRCLASRAAAFGVR